MSIGLAGQLSHPEVKKAEIKTIKTALKIGVRPRVEINGIHSSNEDIRKYMDLGVRDFSLPSDAVILYQWLKHSGENLRNELSRI
jgi:hypothetical protein